MPVSDANPYGNALRQQHTRLSTESEAGRSADNLRSRTWLVTNPEQTNRLGQPVGYALPPKANQHSSPTPPASLPDAARSPPSTSG